MGEREFLLSILDIAEFVTKAELKNPGKRLIRLYLREADFPRYSDRARYVLQRYSKIFIPTLDEIRRKKKYHPLSRLDTLVLKMEYEARECEKRPETDKE